MAEISALPWNGLTVASTFSGAGGSCLGYRMAGYRVAYAAEFIESARETYKANHPDSYLDPRDVREIKGSEILDIVAGPVDILDGSPPCASFSTAGKREAGWGKVKAYSDGAQRTDDLFDEFIRLVGEVQPRVFVAENVSGLVKGTAKGYFIRVMQGLKAKGYRVACRVLDASWLGVPQSRQRTIFIGVREDLGRQPAHPEPFESRITLRVAIAGGIDGMCQNLGGDLLRIYKLQRPGESRFDACIRLGRKGGGLGKVRLSWDKPTPTMTQSGYDLYHPELPRTLTIPEAKRICSFPDDFKLCGTFEQQWERLGRAVPPLMMREIAATLRDKVLT